MKGRVSEYDNKLRYANEVITNLENENQQIELEIASSKATIEN